MMKTTIFSAALALGLATTTFAQQRPLVTEDPETIGSGLILIEGGVDYQHQIIYPASGLEGNLLRLGLYGVSFGVSSIAEIQVDGGVYNQLSVTDGFRRHWRTRTFTGDSTHDIEDLVIGSKVRLISEAPGRAGDRHPLRDAPARRRQRERPRARYDGLLCLGARR